MSESTQELTRVPRKEYKLSFPELVSAVRKLIDNKPPFYPPVDHLKDLKKLNPLYQMEYWKKDDFDLEKELPKTKGPLLEVAGPTLGGYETLERIINLPQLPQKVFTSNITPGCPMFDGRNGRFLGYVGRVDFMADAQELPIADESLGALFASCLPEEIRSNTLKEAKRVIEPGGLLVWQGVNSKDIDEAKSLGFEVQEIVRFVDIHNLLGWNCIFKKTASSNPHP